MFYIFFFNFFSVSSPRRQEIRPRGPGQRQRGRAGQQEQGGGHRGEEAGGGEAAAGRVYRAAQPATQEDAQERWGGNALKWRG